MLLMKDGIQERFRVCIFVVARGLSEYELMTGSLKVAWVKQGNRAGAVRELLKSVVVNLIEVISP